ncbi:MAG: hypothetical protein JWM80_3058 [Cyanobacteria bacterium RYN_339]|nr:hypothetical protein [Cyanobacteria bacterium RYN_339]
MKAGWTLLLAASLLGQGCATILGSNQCLLDVDVENAPPGTAATLRGVMNDVEVRELGLPVRRFALARGSSYALGVSAPGHKPELIMIKPQLSPYAAAELGAMGIGLVGALLGLVSGNAFFGYTGTALFGASGVGFLVDELTLNFIAFDRDHVVVKLEPR